MPFPLYGYQTISGAEINSADKGMVFVFVYLTLIYLTCTSQGMVFVCVYLTLTYVTCICRSQSRFNWRSPSFRHIKTCWSRFVRAIGAIIISPWSWLICSLSRGTIQSSVILTWDHGSVIMSWIKVCFGLFWMVHYLFTRTLQWKYILTRQDWNYWKIRVR